MVKEIFSDKKGEGWENDQLLCLVVNGRLIVQVKNEHSVNVYRLDAEKAAAFAKAVGLSVRDLS